MIYFPNRVAETMSAAKTVTILVGLVGSCVVLGAGLTQAPLIVGALVGALLGVVLLELAGADRFVVIILASLPWLVLLTDFLPALTLTLTSAFVVVLLLHQTTRRSDIARPAWVGVSMFALVLLMQSLASTSSNQIIEAAKYLLFPAMALVVSSPTSRRQLAAMRPLLLGSGVAAMALQAVVIVLHLGRAGVYYGSGEQLGLSAESPHEMALIGVMIAVACLTSVRDIRWRIAGATVAAAPALATGVRSALVALVLSLIIVAIQARFRPGTILGIAAISVVIVFSGVGAIIVTRYHQDRAKGEYSTFANAGSKRGAVWTTALREWRRSGPTTLAFGAGLRSVERIEEQSLGEPVTAQSDIVLTVVELGIFGVLAWALVWLAILRSAVSWLVLLPLIAYAFTNGSLEYVGAVVYGIALAAACGRSNRSSFGTRPRSGRRQSPCH
jgi:hypothetical protein